MATADKRAIRNPVVRFEVAQHTVVDGSVVAINSACPANCRMVGHTLVASNVTNGITYSYVVTAVDEGNNESAASLEASGKPKQYVIIPPRRGWAMPAATNPCKKSGLNP